MKCPKCSHQAQPGEIKQQGQCPNCGVFYHKVTGGPPPKAYANEVAEPAQPAPAAPRASYAKAAVAADRQRAEAKSGPGSGPARVSLVAVDMPFLSLVWVMTKIILAAVPAAILAGFIIVMIGSFVDGVFSSYQKYSSSAASEERASALTRHDRCTKTEELGGAVMLGRQVGLSRSEAMSSVTGYGDYSDVVLGRIVSSAYERPRHSSAEEQLQQVETFKRETYDWCIREGI